MSGRQTLSRATIVEIQLTGHEGLVDTVQHHRLVRPRRGQCPRTFAGIVVDMHSSGGGNAH